MSFSKEGCFVWCGFTKDSFCTFAVTSSKSIWFFFVCEKSRCPCPPPRMCKHTRVTRDMHGEEWNIEETVKSETSFSLEHLILDQPQPIKFERKGV